MKKRTYKLITWMIVVLTSICIVAVAGIWMVLDRDGLPASVRERISSELGRLGVEAPPSAINGTLAGELVIENPILRDEGLGGMVIFEARRVIVQLDVGLMLKRQFQVEEVRVQDGHLRVPLERNLEEAPVVEATSVNVSVVPSARGYRIERFRGEFEGVPFDVSGTIQKRKRNEIRENSKISIASRLPEVLSDELRRRVFELKELAHAVSRSTNPQLDIRIGEFDSDGFPRIETDLRFGNAIFNGLGMQRVQLLCHAEPEGRIALDLHAFLDGDDYLALDGVYDWNKKTIAADADYRGFPAKIRKALLLSPEALRILPDFSGKAPRLRVTLQESKLLPIEDWAATFRLEAEGTRVVDAALSDVIVEGEWADRVLKITRARATVDEPYAEISGTAIFEPDSGDLMADMELIGNPRSVVKFTRSPRFQRNYLRALESFDWTGAGRPHGRATIVRTMVDGKGSVIVDGQAVMHGAKFNGVTIERAAGSFFVDPAHELVVIDDLELIVDGNRAEVSLAFDFFPEPPELRFAGSGTVVIPTLLSIIDPRLPKKYEGWGVAFPEPVEATASGTIHLRGDKRIRFETQAKSSRMETADAQWQDVSATVAYDSQSRIIQVEDGRAGTLSMGPWTVKGLAGSARVEPGVISFSGRAEHGASQAVDLWDSLVNLRLVNGVASVYTQSEKGRVSDWHFDGVTAETVVDTDKLLIDAFAEGGRYGDSWQFESINGIWRDGGGGQPVRFDYDADSANSAEGAFGGLSVRGHYHEGVVSGFGSAKSAASADGLLTGASVDAVFSQTPGGLTIQARVPGLVLDKNWTISGVDASVAWQEGVPLEVSFDAASAVSRGGMKGGAIEGHLLHSASVDEFDLKLSRISGADWFGDAVHVTGTFTAQATLCAVTAGAAEWRGWHADDIDMLAVVTDRLVSLQQVSGTLASGHLEGDAFIDVGKDSAQVRFHAQDMDLIRLLPNSEGAKEIGGKINASGNLAVSVVDGALKLDGPGRVKLEDANIWKIPLLHDFMKTLDRFVPGSELTKITKAETELDFKGGRVYCPQITTNGSIISLDAVGWYRWDGEVVDFRVRAKPLPEFFLNRFLSRVPFVNKIIGESADVLLERRLKGTLEKPRWENITKILDILRDKERSEATEGTSDAGK